MDRKHAHLAIVQGVINRLSQNSFLLKGWSVVLISALFALAGIETGARFAYIAYFPLFVFWLLDGYFLWQERLYRALYERVRLTADNDVDFSMATDNVVSECPGWLAAAFSKTLIAFHGALLAAVVVVTVLLN